MIPRCPWCGANRYRDGFRARGRWCLCGWEPGKTLPPGRTLYADRVRAAADDCGAQITNRVTGEVRLCSFRAWRDGRCRMHHPATKRNVRKAEREKREAEAAEEVAALRALVLRAATESTVTTADDPGCFYCDLADEHGADCPAARLMGLEVRS